MTIRLFVRALPAATELQMATKTQRTSRTKRTSRVTKVGKKPPMPSAEVRGLHGVRLVAVKGAPQLELRHMLRMPRETFGRLVNVSVRTIATIESEQKKAGRIQRDYVEVKRLCDALSEVVEPSALGEWFRAPNEAFGGSKPIEVIERGEIDRLWEMFYRLRSGVPG